jgi:cytosine/adenosine deaminase-related metal-dependent hydrolase
MTLLIRSATVIAMDDAHGADPFVADIHIEGERIAAVGRDLQVPSGTRVIDGSDRLVVPGLVNAHLHSYAAFQRGRYDNLPLELWMVYAYPSLGVPPMSQRLIYLRTMLVAMESLKSGVTCVVDDVLEMPAQTLGALATVFGAYDEIGIRANCSGHMINRPYVDTLPYAAEILPRELLVEARASPPPTTETYLDFCREAIDRFHDRTGRLRYVIAPSGPQRCTDDLLVGSAELAQEHDVAYHLHVLETKVQSVTGRDFYGKTLVRYMHDLGVLTHRTTVAHAIWVTDEDVGLLADAGASVAHNVNSNLRTGAGVMPFRHLLDAGVTVALGTDGIASNGSARLFDVMRSAALLHKVASPDYEAWPTATEILHAATRAGARSALIDDQIGSIEPGKKADLVLLDLNTYNFTPRNDLRLHLVYSENGTSVDTVLVDGEIVVENGRLTRVDEDALLAEFREAIPEFLAEYAKAETLNARLAPYYAEAYRRCHAEDVGMNRFVDASVSKVRNRRE